MYQPYSQQLIPSVKRAGAYVCGTLCFLEACGERGVPALSKSHYVMVPKVYTRLRAVCFLSVPVAFIVPSVSD